MKKVFCLIFCCILTLAVLATAASAETQRFVFKESKATVQIEYSDAFTSEQLNRMAQNVLNIDYIAAPTTINPWCIINGHDLQTAMVTKTEHYVYSTYPKCVESYYKVEACKRCDYENYRLVSSGRVGCCS